MGGRPKPLRRRIADSIEILLLKISLIIYTVLTFGISQLFLQPDTESSNVTLSVVVMYNNECVWGVLVYVFVCVCVCVHMCAFVFVCMCVSLGVW